MQPALHLCTYIPRVAPAVPCCAVLCCAVPCRAVLCCAVLVREFLFCVYLYAIKMSWIVLLKLGSIHEAKTRNHLTHHTVTNFTSHSFMTLIPR